MADRLDGEFRFHQSALALRAERQQLLASNIANADTPNFKARDVDFRKALTQALAGTSAAVTGDRSQPGAGAQTSAPAETLLASHPAHLSAGGRAASGGLIAGSMPQYRTPRQDSIDGNTVELDAERAQFADNAVRYEASISAVNGKIKSLLAAITGQ